jgi:hypothetical protein
MPGSCDGALHFLYIGGIARRCRQARSSRSCSNLVRAVLGGVRSSTCPPEASLRGGMTHVQGWIVPSTAAYLSGLEVLQRRKETTGDIREIGIHHGLSFLCLALALPPGERAVAIDVFGNEGSSG